MKLNQFLKWICFQTLRNGLVFGLLITLSACGGASPGDSLEEGAGEASEGTSGEAGSGSPTGAQVAGPTIGGCPVFPADHPLNTPVDGLAVHPNSDKIVARLAPTWKFALVANKPYNVVSGVPPVSVVYTQYGKTTAPPQIPIPPNPVFMQKKPGLNNFGQPKKLDDNHAMFVDTDDCKLYEVWSFDGVLNPDGSYTAGSGWMYDLNSNTLPPVKTATATASGISVFATLARADQILAGEINHALAVVTTYTSDGYLSPATSYQAKFGTGPDWDDPNNPVMGQRLRLKADYDISGFGPQAQVVLTAAKKYGLIVTDGSPTAGNIPGDPNPSLDFGKSDLNGLSAVPPEAFEVLYTGDPKL